MKQTITALLSFLFTSSALAISPVQNRINQQVAKGYNVGISVAVITAKGTHYFQAGTLSKQAHARKVSSDTLFQIASISKVMTSLLAADAIEHHQLAANHPINDYLPKSVQLANYNDTPITISDCLAHMAGFPPNPTNFVSKNPENMFEGYTEHDFLQYLKSYKSTIKPGSRYIYSNVGYSLIGYIVSRIHHQPYSDLLRTQITKPLMMNHTYVTIPASQQKNLATSYGANDLATGYINLAAITPAGGISSNTSDLVKYAKAYMGINKTSLLPAMRLTLKPIGSEGTHSKDGNFSGESAMSISMGWNIDPEHHAIWKNGNLYGVSSFIGFNQDKTLGVVVLTNTGNVSYTDNLALHILDPQLKYMPLYQQIKQPKKTNQRYAGTYQVNKHEAYRFQPHDGLITTTHIRDGRTSRPFNVYPMSTTKYFGKVDNAVFTFLINKNGNVLGFTLNENGHETKATKR